MSKDWIEDFEHENGNSQNICKICNSKFMGHKIRRVCKECYTQQQVSVEPVIILPKPTNKTFTYEDLEKAYNDGYKNGMMNEAGLECTLFSSWYNWVHEIKSKSKA